MRRKPWARKRADTSLKPLHRRFVTVLSLMQTLRCRYSLAEGVHDSLRALARAAPGEPSPLGARGGTGMTAGAVCVAIAGAARDAHIVPSAEVARRAAPLMHRASRLLWEWRRCTAETRYHPDRVFASAGQDVNFGVAGA